MKKNLPDETDPACIFDCLRNPASTNLNTNNFGKFSNTKNTDKMHAEFEHWMQGSRICSDITFGVGVATQGLMHRDVTGCIDNTIDNIMQ